MSQIYANAVVTIIAAASESTSVGIISDRDSCGIGSYEGPTCSLPWKRDDSGADSTANTGQAAPEDSSSRTGLRTLTTSEIYTAWYSMAENYSKRKLTNDTDKLMALAKTTREFVTNRYCAGLWENDLIPGLLWTFDAESWSHTEQVEVPPGSNLFESRYAGLRPNSDSKLPSWTWASINNEVEWRFKEACSVKTAEPYMETARVDNLKVVYSSESQYGGLHSCELVLTAPTYSWSTFDVEDDDDDGFYVNGENDGNAEGNRNAEVDDSAKNNGNTEDNRLHSEFHKRLLRKVKDDEEFKARHIRNRRLEDSSYLT